MASRRSCSGRSAGARPRSDSSPSFFFGSRSFFGSCCCWNLRDEFDSRSLPVGSLCAGWILFDSAGSDAFLAVCELFFGQLIRLEWSGSLMTWSIPADLRKLVLDNAVAWEVGHTACVLCARRHLHASSVGDPVILLILRGFSAVLFSGLDHPIYKY